MNGMDVSLNAASCPRKESRVWLAIPVVFWTVILVMSLLSAIHLWAVAGVGWLVICGVWGFGVWYAAFRALMRHVGEALSAWHFVVGMLVTCALAMLPPFVAGLRWFDIDLASSAAFLAFAWPVGAFVVGLVSWKLLRYPFAAEERRRAWLWNDFATRFEHGPVGAWRAEMYPGRVGDSVSELIFWAEGTGEYRTSGNVTRFEWRGASYRRIEVRTAGADWLELVVCLGSGESTSPISATLSLLKSEWLNRDISSPIDAVERVMEDLENDDGLWPVTEQFDYVGEAPARPTP
jgi:hypothetical protein